MKYVLLVLAATMAAAAAAAAVPELDDSCIKGCKCREDVSIGRKLRISDCQRPIALTATTFKNHSKPTNVIHFENVVITKITDGAFGPLVDLETVTMKSCKIGVIESSAFDLPDLGIVSFSECTFAEVPDLASTNLEELLFDSCRLKAIPRLGSLQALILLNVANNAITEIDVATFANTPTLEEVVLTNNSITSLPADVFNNLTALNTLYIDNNPLTTFTLDTVSNLELLSLKSCKLTTFAKATGANLDVLSRLDLSYNEIKDLPADTFAAMEELTFIDLSFNRLERLDAAIFQNNPKLVKIILDGNNLRALPLFQSRFAIFQTNYFSCNNCGLTLLHNATFEHMPGITSLRLSVNNLKHLGGALERVTDLRELDVSNNFLTEAELSCMSRNTALETLNLSGNPVHTLEPLLSLHNRVLKKVDASNCKVEQLWKSKNKVLPLLERLLIRGNMIEAFTIQDLMATPNVKLLDLDDNPLNCTQDFKDLVLWLIKTSVYPIQGEDRVRTHDALVKDASSFEQNFDQEIAWKGMAYRVCGDEHIFDEDNVSMENGKIVAKFTFDAPKAGVEAENAKDQDSSYADNYDEDDYYDEDTSTATGGRQEEGGRAGAAVRDGLTEERMTFARIFYVLSLTSVFVITALVVLTVVLSATLMVLRRHGALQAHAANLPRVKIPLWNAAPGQKKHSGSVYRPLSEDLSGSKTPIINRYEFRTTPAVHSVNVP